MPDLPPTQRVKPVDLLSVEYVSGVCVVTLLVRDLDSRASEELSSRLLALLNETKVTKYVLDFDSVRYMESACFGALVTFLKWLSRFDGRVVLANVSENVRFLFNVTRLDKVFLLCGDVPTALHELEKAETR